MNTHAHSVDAKLVKFIMGAIDFIILLPPSEGKTAGGDRARPWTPSVGTFGAPLKAARTQVCKELSALDGGDARLLGVKGAHLERAQNSNSSLVRSPSLAAWQRYSGVVWEHLDLGSLPAAERNKILRRIFVPSGMAGLVRADDPLPDYRLKMGARVADLGLLSTWWRPLLTPALATAAKSRVIVDLLPNEHRAAFDWPDLPTTVRVDLVSRSGAVVGGHNAKAAKGRLARHLLTSGGTDLGRMVSSFKDPEYSARITKGRP